MTLSDIQNKIYSLTGTDSTSYPNATMLIDLNLWYQKIVTMILDSQDEADFDDLRQTDYPISTIPLTTNRDYSIAQSYNMLKMKDVSVTYDGTKYYRALPVDDTENMYGIAPSSAGTANTTIDANFSKNSPRYDLKYNAIWLYPIASTADVSAGAQMILEWFRSPVEFTSGDLTTGTASPGFDISFHGMMAYGPAFEYAQQKQLPNKNDLAGMLQDYEARLKRQYSSKQLDRKYRVTPDFQNYK